MARFKKLANRFFLVFLWLVVMALPLGVYVYTLAPTITAGDNSEMVTAAITLGIPHPSSYPINTILGNLFTKIPFGELPWRVNLMSAVLNAFTVGVIFISALLFLRLLAKEEKFKIGWPEAILAFGSSLFLAFSHTFWINSLKMEVFALNDFFAGLLILFALIYFLRPNSLYFIALSLILGLGFAHHQTIIMILPAVVYLVWLQDRQLFEGLVTGFLKFILPEKQGKQLGKVRLGKKKAVIVVFSLLIVVIGLSSYFSLMWLARRQPEMNWGDPVDLSRLWRAFTRVDTGGFASPAIYDQSPQTAPLRQLEFYGRSLIKDFTYWGIFLGLLGLWALWRQSRSLFTFVALGIFFSGPFFVVYANFPLDGSFAQATVVRFNLLSEFFWTLSIAVALAWLWRGAQRYLTGREASNRFARILLVTGFGLIFLVTLLTHFKAVDQRPNRFAYELGKIMLAQTEDNALIMVSGDIPNFVLDYFKFVENAEGNRIIFSPGQLHMSWFLAQLPQEYPDLVIPPPYPGNRFTLTHQLIEANWDSGRPIYIMPELSQLDPEVGARYQFWPKGLLFRVFQPEKKEEATEGEEAGTKEETPEATPSAVVSEKSPPEQPAEEGPLLEPPGLPGADGEEQEPPSELELRANEFLLAGDQLWQMINPDELGWLLADQPNLDSPMFFYYPRHFYNLGTSLETVGWLDDAIIQYQRTLEIDGTFAQAYKALGLIYGYKMPEEKRDPYLAIENLQSYLYYAPSLQEAQAAQQAIYELSQPPEEATESAELTGEEATGSGDLEN